MPEVKPFAAIRYDFERLGGDLSTVLAPPYDVLDQTNKDALLARSDHNIVAIDLPHIPPKSAGPPDRYDAAAKRLADWRSDGTLIREGQPALYVYHQRFEHHGETHVRKKFIARVRLQPFSEGMILPHEQTFGGPKEDRLALTKATAVNLSPIFGLYTDPKQAIEAAFAATVATSPAAIGSLEGIENRLWIVTDPGVIDTVGSAMAEKKIYIADGHHRYGTALMYRDWFIERQGGTIPRDHPAHYVLFVLASMDDPGCLILPYHRVLVHVDVDDLVDAWSSGAEPATGDRADIVLYDGESKRETPLRFSDRGMLRSLEPNECEPWYDLDAAYLHRYLIDELLVRRFRDRPQIRYVKSAEDARRVAREESGVALLVNATPMAHLRAVSEAGGLMPQKSTYFYPKLATGLTINPLA